MDAIALRDVVAVVILVVRRGTLVKEIKTSRPVLQVAVYKVNPVVHTLSLQATE